MISPVDRRRLAIWLGVGIVGFWLGTMPAIAAQPAVFAGSAPGIAVNGYDVVAYFTQNQPVRGNEAFSYSWNGAVWRFASAENRDEFAKAPEKFAPQYGGYCAFAVAHGATASSDPAAFSIVDGKLYLNLSPQIRSAWRQDIAGNIARANANWPGVLK